jgi:dienelactone hydrolase
MLKHNPVRRWRRKTPMSVRPKTRHLVQILVLAGSLPIALAGGYAAEAVRVLPAGQHPQDRRLGELRTLNDYFPFTPCESAGAWAVRAERVRRQILVATGLWPMPTQTLANAVIHGKIDRDTYTVEKVYLESFPGHFVTGSLYRPKRGGRTPGVLCPHGHWPEGRFYDAGQQKVGQEIAAGAERFPVGGRYPLQARCVQLARMGCTVFHYDMVGVADSVQLGHALPMRSAMNSPRDWGYSSPQAESRLENMLGLQTYNSIRVLDWFSQLPEVDAARIGVTGASGGGTQTFILSAIDPRPAVAFPAVMVSTAMQGGCICENACYLRIGTGNVEFAALFAPRPLGMTAADDWTKEILTKGLPELKRHYRMLGAEDRVMAKAFLQFPHNYNYVSRAVMYSWMNRHLGLECPEPIVEADFQPLSRAEMSVWDQRHPRPTGGDAYERSLLRWITRDSERRLSALVPKDAQSLAHYRRIVGGAIDVMIGRGVPPAGEVIAASRQEQDCGDYRQVKLLVCHPSQGEQVPVVLLSPVRAGKQVVVWIDPLGKQGLWGKDGKPRPAVARLLSQGRMVVGADLLGQGELTTDGRPLAKARLVDNRTHAGYTFGYNPPLVAQRVHDILSLVSWLRYGPVQAERVDLVGFGGVGAWVAAARAQAGPLVQRAALDTAGFRFADVAAIDDPNFLPGGAKYLDLPGILALSAPHATWLAGEGTTAPVVQAAYTAAGRPDCLTLSGLAGSAAEDAAIEWLLK